MYRTAHLFAQRHLRILSGLYGVLKPLDLMQPYRLEMGCGFAVTPKKNSLYMYWGIKITQAVNKALEAQGDETLINLASNEYFRSIQRKNHRIASTSFDVTLSLNAKSTIHNHKHIPSTTVRAPQTAYLCHRLSCWYQTNSSFYQARILDPCLHKKASKKTPRTLIARSIVRKDQLIINLAPLQELWLNKKLLSALFMAAARFAQGAVRPPGNS